MQQVDQMEQQLQSTAQTLYSMDTDIEQLQQQVKRFQIQLEENQAKYNETAVVEFQRFQQHLQEYIRERKNNLQRTSFVWEKFKELMIYLFNLLKQLWITSQARQSAKNDHF